MVTTQLSTQRTSKATRQGSETDHSAASGAEVKNVWSYISTPSIRLHGVPWNNFTVFTIATFSAL